MSVPSEIRIAALEAELAALRAEMQDFTAAVSHDLRAPLRHIVSYVQLVQEDAGPLLTAEVQEFLTTVTASARHMGVLLDGLTALSRLGSMPLVIAPVSLQEVLQNIRDDLGSKAAQRTVEWQIATDLPLVQADAQILRQALGHVVGNALKFTAPRQQAIIQIRTQPSQDPGYVDLLVRDNGVGFNPALQNKLFSAFGRLHSAQQFDGIGMGLVLTRKLVQRLGGRVGIEAVLDGGCCVTVTLPLA